MAHGRRDGSDGLLGDAGAHRAVRLRSMLDDGVLPDARPVELTHATVATLDLAVRLTLAEIDHLGYPEVTGPDVRDRWRAAEADIELLWRLVIA